MSATCMAAKQTDRGTDRVVERVENLELLEEVEEGRVSLGWVLAPDKRQVPHQQPPVLHQVVPECELHCGQPCNIE